VRATLDDPALSYFNFQEPLLSGQLHAAETRSVHGVITAEIETPTIGIGAGPDCDGQVLVFHDLVNLTFGQPAKFVRHYGDASALITQSILAFKADVVSHRFPNDAESYHLPKETQAALETVLHRKQALRR